MSQDVTRKDEQSGMIHAQEFTGDVQRVPSYASMMNATSVHACWVGKGPWALKLLQTWLSKGRSRLVEKHRVVFENEDEAFES